MSQQQPNWFVAGVRDFQVRHNRLKKAVHEGWRYPLPRWGQAAMGFVYFCIPVVGGYFVMQWAISKSHESIGERGELLKVKEVQGIGDMRVIDTDSGEMERVGAGGWGGGVHLAVSDVETQRKNREKLDKFLKRQKKMQERNSGDRDREEGRQE